MRKAVGNVSTLAVSILLSCLASAGASEQVKVVPEGGLAKDWILQPGHALAAPGYPATFADRGDDVCVAIGYRVQPDGTTSDYVMLGMSIEQLEEIAAGHGGRGQGHHRHRRIERHLQEALRRRRHRVHRRNAAATTARCC
jgi:hypothetical protein